MKITKNLFICDRTQLNLICSLIKATNGLPAVLPRKMPSYNVSGR